MLFVAKVISHEKSLCCRCGEECLLTKEYTQPENENWEVPRTILCSNEECALKEVDTHIVEGMPKEIAL